MKFNGILQYKNMRTGEYFAQSAKVSTEKMEQLSVKTKQETVSIHVITILTLFFLPGTFVAVRYGLSCLSRMVLWALTRCQTFFSSGIINFDDDEITNIGDWVTKWSALKLFGLICGPLMCITLSAWAMAYYFAHRQHRKNSSPFEGDDSSYEKVKPWAKESV